MKTSITIYPAASPTPHRCDMKNACVKMLGASDVEPDKGQRAFSGALDQAVLTGALNQLMRYTLTGCGRSAMCAAFLLERLAASSGTSAEMRAMCCHVCAVLEDANSNKEIAHG